MWVNIRRRRAENFPQRKSGIICRETVYVFQKRQLLLHKCCLRSNHRPASWRHLKSEPDILLPAQSSPTTTPTSPPPPAWGRPEAHSSIGNLKKPGGEKSEHFTGCYCAEQTLPLAPRSKELYLAMLNCTSEANMLFNPSRVILMESNGAVCVCTLCQLLELISAGAFT